LQFFLHYEYLNLFADETGVFSFDCNQDSLFCKGNDALRTVNEWFLANKLSLNIDKTVYSIYSGHRNINASNYSLELNNVPLVRNKSVKYLGVHIDESLTWKEHIEHILTKSGKKFSSLFHKLRNIMPANILRNIYFAMVHSHLIYGVEIYANTDKTILDPLIKLNNKLLCILQFKHSRKPVCSLYRHFKTLPVNKLHEMYILLFVHKFKHNNDNLPFVYHCYFKMNADVHSHVTRQGHEIHLSVVHKSFGQRCLKFRSGKLWNGLPYLLQTCLGFHRFRQIIKHRMLLYLHL
jgi:hypothetical protein